MLPTSAVREKRKKIRSKNGWKKKSWKDRKVDVVIETIIVWLYIKLWWEKLNISKINKFKCMASTFQLPPWNWGCAFSSQFELMESFERTRTSQLYHNWFIHFDESLMLVEQRNVREYARITWINFLWKCLLMEITFAQLERKF